MIDCQALHERITTLAVQSPEEPLPDEIRQHIERCESCRNELHQTREAWLILPAALETGPVNEAMEKAILDRVHTEPVADLALVRPAPLAAMGRYVLAATILIALLAGTLMAPRFFGPRGDVVEQEIARIRDLARQMDRLDQLENVFAVPTLRFASFTTVNASSSVQGYLVYDLLANEGHFFGFDLRKSKHETFALWLLDQSGNVVASAAVDVAEKELGTAIVTLPDNPSILREAIVTTESAPDAVRPSSAVYMRTRIEL